MAPYRGGQSSRVGCSTCRVRLPNKQHLGVHAAEVSRVETSWYRIEIEEKDVEASLVLIKARFPVYELTARVNGPS